MTADLGLDAGSCSSPANHSPDVVLKQGIAGQLPGAAAGRAEEWLFPFCTDAGCRDAVAW
ncbi:hypothetical protein [Tunturiibacter gelidoferens]|uniref:Uncharacterized protein n=1 Tax=Tunturiibacter gelidiferens TaxID=3069689 RepID=A0A9X0U858_9BACT|nr:hypothetical protein [Edaphobacter lichenicola]MBB5331702.1 hypothetical protein [Edaphobacter lichenicola]